MTFPLPGSLLPTGRPARDLGALFDGWDLLPWTDSFPRHADVYPALNAWADDDNLHVEAEVPGLGLADLQISVLGDELCLSGERRDVVDEGTTYHRRERSVGAFRRVLQLPYAGDADKVDARLTDGVLTITLPKAESQRPRRIEVKGN
jgi:HSP20 family protein